MNVNYSVFVVRGEFFGEYSHKACENYKLYSARAELFYKTALKRFLRSALRFSYRKCFYTCRISSLKRVSPRLVRDNERNLSAFDYSVALGGYKCAEISSAA